MYGWDSLSEDKSLVYADITIVGQESQDLGPTNARICLVTMPSLAGTILLHLSTRVG